MGLPHAQVVDRGSPYAQEVDRGSPSLRGGRPTALVGEVEVYHLCTNGRRGSPTPCTCPILEVSDADFVRYGPVACATSSGTC